MTVKKKTRTRSAPSKVPVEEIIDEADKLVPELLESLRKRANTDPLVAVAVLVMVEHEIVGACARRATTPAERKLFYNSLTCVAVHARERAQAHLAAVFPEPIDRRRKKSTNGR